jgi:hypothetical protein
MKATFSIFPPPPCLGKHAYPFHNQIRSRHNVIYQTFLVKHKLSQWFTEET